MAYDEKLAQRVREALIDRTDASGGRFRWVATFEEVMGRSGFPSPLPMPLAVDVEGERDG